MFGMIEVTLAGLALVLLCVLTEVADVGQMILEEVDVQRGLMLASGFVDKPCKAIFTEAVNFDVDSKMGFKLGKFVNAQALEVFFWLICPMLIELKGWAFYRLDIVSMMERETTKSAQIALVRFPVLLMFYQWVQAVFL